MNQISRKLRSNSGASMLIALVFMMFCLFVGGSVLAAASANGYRVAHLSDQQDFLNQRSAALLLADEMDGDKAQPKLKIEDVVLTETPMIQLPGGGLVADNRTGRTAKETRTITFTVELAAGKTMTAVQRLMFETAVCRYLKEINMAAPTGENAMPAGFVIKLENFGTDVTSIANFWSKYNGPGENAVVGGTLNITGNKGTAAAPGAEFTTYNANFTSGGGTQLYDFLMTFDNTQMTVTSNAYMSKREITQPGEIRDDPGVTTGLNAGETAVIEVAASTVRTTIKWQPAYIEKGGE